MRTLKKQTYTLTFIEDVDLRLLEKIEDEIYDELSCTGVVERYFNRDINVIKVFFTTRQNKSKVQKVVRESIPEQYNLYFSNNDFLVAIVR